MVISGVRGLPNRFLESLTALLSRPPPAPARAPAGELTPASRRNGRGREDLSGSLTPAAFEAQLEWALGGTKQLLPGRLVFFRASGIAAQFGERWKSAADRAESIAAQTIERHLSLPDDAYVRLDTLTYLVLFSRTPAATANAAAGRIATEIAEQLLGTSWEPEQLTLLTVFGRIPDGLEARSIPIPGPRSGSLLDSILRSAEAGEKLGSGREASADDPFRETTLVYRPMWDVQLGVLSTYLAVPAQRTASGELRAGTSEMMTAGDAELTARLDAVVVGRVAAELEESVAAGRKFLVGIPVHFDTLAARGSRTEFLAACDAIPLAARRLVIFELLNVPVGVPVGRLQTISSLLKSRARSVIVCVPLQTNDFSSFSEAGVLSVGADVAQDGGAERTIIAQMQRFVAAAEKAKLHPFIHGLRTTSLTSSAVAAGFRYVDGNSVRSLIDAPQELRRYQPADLYMKLAQGRE